MKCKGNPILAVRRDKNDRVCVSCAKVDIRIVSLDVCVFRFVFALLNVVTGVCVCVCVDACDGVGVCMCRCVCVDGICVWTCTCV